jgi:energy-converting hydrogenase Eha subunit A
MKKLHEKFVNGKLHTFLKEKAPNVIDKIADLAGKSGIPMVSTIGNVVDMLIPDMKEEIQPLIDDYEQNDLPLILADLADARNREIQIATSEHAPTINKIITPILAIGIVVLTFLMFYFVLFKKLGIEKDIIIYILGVLSGLLTQVISYFFGSSAGSRDKSETIKKIMNQ